MAHGLETGLGETLYAIETHITTAADGLSASVLLNGRCLVGVVMPSAWTDANLTFKAGLDDVTFQDMYDAAGSEVTVVAGASRYIPVAASAYADINHLKVRSGPTATPVQQGAERTLYLVVRRID